MKLNINTYTDKINKQGQQNRLISNENGRNTGRTSDDETDHIDTGCLFFSSYQGHSYHFIQSYLWSFCNTNRCASLWISFVVLVIFCLAYWQGYLFLLLMNECLFI